MYGDCGGFDDYSADLRINFVDLNADVSIDVYDA